MGMFDTVMEKCPTCGEILSIQTKSGPCLLAEYWLDNAPMEVLDGVAGEPVLCKCGKWWTVYFVRPHLMPSNGEARRR